MLNVAAGAVGAWHFADWNTINDDEFPDMFYQQTKWMNDISASGELIFDGTSALVLYVHGSILLKIN